jgi:hypothetical protein
VRSELLDRLTGAERELLATLSRVA